MVEDLAEELEVDSALAEEELEELVDSEEALEELELFALAGR